MLLGVANTSAPTPPGPSSAICVFASPNSTFSYSIVIFGYNFVNSSPACLINSSVSPEDSQTLRVISSVVNPPSPLELELGSVRLSAPLFPHPAITIETINPLINIATNFFLMTFLLFLLR